MDARSQRTVAVFAICVAAVGAFLIYRHSRQASDWDPAATGRHEAPGYSLYTTNLVLERLSTNNAAFQAWGKELMLKMANDHLSKVPLFGLKKGPLGPDDVVVTTILSMDGAELDLSTVDSKHSVIYYPGGKFMKAVAWKAEMTGLFRDPSRMDHWGENIGVWSAAEARKAGEALLRAKGITPRKIGAKSVPTVRPDIFDVPMPDGSIKPVCVFYTVRWPDAESPNDDCIEVRFRHTAEGSWEATEWVQASKAFSDTETTNFANLYQRFFASAPVQ